MIMTTRAFAGVVLAVSAAVLGTALLSEYWGGLAPCELCLLQRWPWAAAIVRSLVVVLVGDRPALPWVALILGIVFAIGIAFAFYHVGVEQHWFAGPSACTASSTGAMTLEQMKQQIMGTAPVLCDRPAWALYGISMAGFNLLASLIMAVFCFLAFVRARRPARSPAGSGMRRGAA
jgi:disulfide bond formation protein DsbB